MIKNLYRSSIKVPLFLSDFRNLNSFDRFSQNTQISSLMKIRPVGAEMFHAERGTDGQT
jgi:hypothetical protein